MDKFKAILHLKEIYGKIEEAQYELTFEDEKDYFHFVDLSEEVQVERLLEEGQFVITKSSIQGYGLHERGGITLEQPLSEERVLHWETFNLLRENDVYIDVRQKLHSNPQGEPEWRLLFTDEGYLTLDSDGRAVYTDEPERGTIEILIEEEYTAEKMRLTYDSVKRFFENIESQESFEYFKEEIVGLERRVNGKEPGYD